MKLSTLPQNFLLTIILLSSTLMVSSSQTLAQNSNSQPSKPNPISASQAQVIRKDLFVTSAPGIRIFVREVGFNNNLTNTGNTGTPILLIHGGGGGGLATFDVNVPGYSLAEKFAKAGHLVYVMNVRGWERSTRPAALKAELVNAPSVKTVIIPNSGHFLLLDRPERGRDRFVTETISFIQ